MPKELEKIEIEGIECTIFIRAGLLGLYPWDFSLEGQRMREKIKQIKGVTLKSQWFGPISGQNPPGIERKVLIQQGRKRGLKEEKANLISAMKRLINFARDI